MLTFLVTKVPQNILLETLSFTFKKAASSGVRVGGSKKVLVLWRIPYYCKTRTARQLLPEEVLLQSSNESSHFYKDASDF